MKKYKSLFAVFFLILMLLLPSFSAYAEEEMWSEQYYRAIDTTGTLSEEEQQAIDSAACEWISKYHYDLISMTLSSDSYTDTLEEDAEAVYADSDFGYGEDASGLMLAYDADTSDIVILRYGSAQEIPDAFLNTLVDILPQYYEENQAYGIMYAFQLYMQSYENGDYDESLGKTSGAEDSDPEEEIAGISADSSLFAQCVENSGIERVGDADNTRPFWYPVSTQNFTFYNDANIPRVVDEADIFTDEEEAQMQQLITEYVEETQHDIVIFTDTTDYGLGHDVYAADFYDFNGYGIGEENEGMCLLICMDPNNRGWYACATGTDTRELYTYSASYALDDTLAEYMSDGNYAEGVLDWIGNIYTMYEKGMPFAPDWWPDRDKILSAEETAAAPRLVDHAGLFSESEAAELQAEAESISEKYGIDVVISTEPENYCHSSDGFCELFYERYGYGAGEDHSGYCLTLYSYEGAGMYAGGSAGAELSDMNRTRIQTYTSSRAEKGDYYQAAKTWLKHIRHYERTGRVIRPVLTWVVFLIVALLAAFIYSKIAFRIAKKKMESVQLAQNADAYIDGEADVTVLKDIFLRTTSTRKPRPKDTGSSRSRGSSSDSSYSSSYSGSSGRSHSGSGRSF